MVAAVLPYRHLANGQLLYNGLVRYKAVERSRYGYVEKESVMDKVADVAHDAKNAVKDAAHNVKNAVQDAASDVKASAKEAEAKAKAEPES